MASVMRTLALLASMSVASGEYSCPVGYADLTGTPLCAGVIDESCGVSTCCKQTGKMCSKIDAITGNSKCKTGDDKNYFFDLKKGLSVAASDSDADIVATCCTQCTKATCADWQTVKALVGCGTGMAFLGTNALPASDCAIPADAKYKETCCVSQPTTCAATNVISGNANCKSGAPINDFFDLKKSTSVPASDSDADFKGSCCTKCSAATCADWQPVKLLVGCGTGKALAPTNALPAADCAIPSDDKYKETCCATTPTYCASTNAITGNAKCKTGSDKNYFFDLKKAASEVASASDADFVGACCSKCSAATCADWQPVKLLTSCGTGKYIVGTNTLASADCAIPADDKYKEACCAPTPTTCASTNAITGNAKCKSTAAISDFFDLKKTASVPASKSRVDFQKACCTKCSAATCADWQTVKALVGCGTGKYILGTTALASADCAIPVDAKYKETCCATAPIICSGTNAISGNAKCKTGSDKNYFFDLHKGAATAASASDADFVGACCSKCSEAKCADWQPVKALVGCGTGKVFAATNVLPSSDCAIPADAKYKETCCGEPMKCADYDKSQDSTRNEASAALPKVSPFRGTLVASFLVLVGVHNLWI